MLLDMQPNIRVGMYVRVSSEEQSKYGLSIQQQIDDLTQWAGDNHVTVYDWYKEEGVSASSLKRPELQRLLSDVQLGRIDKIVCTKLDRLTRRPGDYYKIMDVLGPHRCMWQTVLEDYDTETTNGRLMIDIRMAVASAELGLTSDRVKNTLSGKKLRGEPVNGSAPIGYKIEGKKYVIDANTADKVRAYFDCFLQRGTLLSAYHAVRDLGYGYTLETYRKMLRNPIYTGQLYGNDDMCPAIITKDKFAEVQRLIASRSRTPAEQNQVYLFTGLLVCADCGRSYVSGYHQHKRKDGTVVRANRYNCSEFRHRGAVAECTNSSISEACIEQILLDNIRQLASQNIIMDVQYADAKPLKRKPNPNAIRDKLLRLQEVYIDGGMPKETYETRRAKLQQELVEATTYVDNAPQKQADKLKKLLEQPFEQIYQTLTEPERKEFWRGIINHITVYPKDHVPRIVVVFK